MSTVVLERPESTSEDAFEMRFEASTIKHLGLQMYSSLPPVIGELVANAWDAGASTVRVSIPTDPITDASTIVIEDDGAGMTDEDVQNKYLAVGRDRRAEEGDAPILVNGKERPMMGRKGIGKFSGFGVAAEIEVETVKEEVSRFVMNYDRMMDKAKQQRISFPKQPPSGTLARGTRITLRSIRKYRSRRISISQVRRWLARQFSVIGEEHDFQVVVNDVPLTMEERDLKRLLDVDTQGNRFLWEFDDEEIKPDSGWHVSGWMGTLDPGRQSDEVVQRGVVIMARGKMVQSPFFFNLGVGQPYALSYLIGEIHAEFVDTSEEDSVGTSRTSLVWDTPANEALQEWGRRQMSRIAKEWSEKRKEKNEVRLESNELYQRFRAETGDLEERRNFNVADRLIRQVIAQNPAKEVGELEPVIQMAIDFVEFDAFLEFAEALAKTDIADVSRLMALFRQWQLVEAKEMMRVTDGRIKTIEKLERMIAENALEVPDLHRFLKKFPWVIDPKWTLVDDEVRYSDLLRAEFPDDELPEEDRRIDFLCVREGTTLAVVEIKRPHSRASVKELDQIRDYVHFMRDYVTRTSDPEFAHKDVVGYLVVGNSVDTWMVRQRVRDLAEVKIYVRLYGDMLSMVKRLHDDFLRRYQALRAVTDRSSGEELGTP